VQRHEYRLGRFVFAMQVAPCAHWFLAHSVTVLKTTKSVKKPNGRVRYWFAWNMCFNQNTFENRHRHFYLKWTLPE